MAQKFGGKWTLSLGILIMSICNALIPKAVDYGMFDKYPLSFRNSIKQIVFISRWILWIGFIAHYNGFS